ncbi:MAG TPA: FAD-dependent monooxygenase [Rhabdochlamydiaceae bacterium]
MTNKRVLISGAGVAGITLAYLLKQQGFTPTLVERSPILRTGGYKIDIRGAALEVLKRMGTYSLVYEGQTDMRGATFVDSSGKNSSDVSADLCGGRVEGDMEIMRGNLCEILFQQLEDVECLFGDCITEISQAEEGVYVAFEKNAPREFDLVVGADGLHSTVRKLAFGDESQFLQELGLYISVYTIPNILNLDQWEIEYFEPHKFVNVYSSRGDRNAKAGFAFSSKPLQFDPRDTNEQKKLLEEAFKHVGWEVPRLLAEMKEAPDFYFDYAAQIHMPHWSEGRVVLVGDAGYAPSPLSGQGTSLAIVGAYVLAGELSEAQGDHKIAFAEYEKVLRKFAKRNQDLVGMNVSLLGDKDSSWASWLSHHVQQLLPESWNQSLIQFFKSWGVKRIYDAANDITLKNYSNS